MKKSFLTFLAFAALIPLAISQPYSTGPRLFLDIPMVHLAAPDVTLVANRIGLGAGTAMNVATHWSTARIGGGAVFSLDPQSKDVQESFITTPYVMLEAGAGKYRTNGNQCSKSKQTAFTVMGKAGVRYAFISEALKPDGEVPDKFDVTVGAEFGLFYIRDIFKNTEVFLDANYHVNAKIISANFGFKMFLNLRASPNDR
ncbi:MAG: hypothetical protein SFV22_19075 [Saprospiraceae bacterium]|nr:hypothetical protein [Saprospiraceae bacterium]